MSEVRLDRRGFVKWGAALGTTTLGVLAGAAPALATFGRRSTYLPTTPSTIAPPVPPTPLAFEVGSGVNPHLMTRVAQDYLAATLSPDHAAQVVQALAAPRQAVTFHQQFISNYALANPLPITRGRFGYLVGVNTVVQADAQVPFRPAQDLNYYELRRLIHPGEVAQFGLVLSPAKSRQAPTPVDVDNFSRIARTYYGLPYPEMFTLLYTRLFSNGRNNFVGFLASRGPDPVRSPFKDLLLDVVPVM